MKNSKFIIVAVLVAISMFILPGCDKQLIEENQKVVVANSDISVKSQVQWLYDNHYIDSHTYQDWSKNGVNFYVTYQGKDGRAKTLDYPINIAKNANQETLQVDDMSSANSLARFHSDSNNPKIKSQVKWLYDNNQINLTQYDDWTKNGVLFDIYSEATGFDLVYPVNSDVRPSVDYVDKMNASDKLSENARHRVYGTRFKGGTINVAIHTINLAVMPNSWINAIIDACAEWNNLGYNVKFSPYLTTSTTDIVNTLDISYALIGSSDVLAYTQPISSINGAEWIKINTMTIDLNLDASVKKFTIMHELGHAIGIAHTDTYDGNVAASSISCNSSSNIQSLFRQYFNTGTGINGLSFTACDKANIAYYWPKGLS